ncbi:unnamed protein product [Rotaria sp. Silwood1]|nr:unnamed protein product [Rotaria sp. Silwood1]
MTTKQKANNVPRSIWPINKLVVVPAMWKEINWTNPLSWPLWLRTGLNMTKNNSVPYHVHLYQRMDPQSRPPYNWPYCRNVHEEAGVYLQFIYDYYYDLPEKILFLHGNPFAHSTHPIETALCVRDDVHYVNINSYWIQNRPWSIWSQDANENGSLMYPCASRILKILGYNPELQLNPSEINPKDNSFISTYCCAQFYVTKQRIHHYTYEQWLKLYNASHEPYCTTERDREKPGEPGLKWFGGSFEHLWHVILGLYSTNMQVPISGTNTDRCHLFRSSCLESPC